MFSDEFQLVVFIAAVIAKNSVIDLVEHGGELVVVILRPAFERVIMAFGATEAGAEKDLSHGFGAQRGLREGGQRVCQRQRSLQRLARRHHTVAQADAQGLVGLDLAACVQIKADLDEARALRDEAKELLASYERKQQEVQEQSERIVAAAKDEALNAAKQAKEDLKASIARRVAAAEDQISSAEASALRQVREKAVTVAIAAATEILAKQITAESASASIDAAIEQVDAKLH